MRLFDAVMMRGASRDLGRVSDDQQLRFLRQSRQP